MLRTLATIVDLVAAADVIGSLLFLAFQLREQNREISLGTPGAREWRAEAKPKGRFMPATVRNIEAAQAEGRVPMGPHLQAGFPAAHTRLSLVHDPGSNHRFRDLRHRLRLLF
jgi:hypothetical protein